LIDITPGKE